MSKFRPQTQIIGATPYEKTYHQLALIWGVTPLKVEYSKDIEELFADCAIKAKMAEYIKPGDHMVISAGVPVDIPGSTNIIRVLEVK